MGVTLHTIAEKCKVDVSTVSRALRDDPRVKPETHQRIHLTAKELGYFPNLHARSLQSGKTRTIWFIMPSLMPPLERETAEYASQFLIQQQYDMLVAVHNHDPSAHRRLLERLEQGVADAAMIIPGSKLNMPELKRLIEKKFPMIFIDRHYEELKTTVVTNANYESSQRLVEFCHTQGAEEFIVLHEAVNPAAKARLDGTIRKIKAIDCKYHIFSDGSVASRQLKLTESTIAILANSQSGAHHFVTQNRSVFTGKKIVVGTYDHWHGEPDPAEKVFVCIQNFRRMAEIATDRLMKILKNSGKTRETEFIEVPPLEYREISRQFPSRR